MSLQDELSLLSPQKKMYREKIVLAIRYTPLHRLREIQDEDELRYLAQGMIQVG
jgi:hypothetical protein